MVLWFTFLSAACMAPDVIKIFPDHPERYIDAPADQCRNMSSGAVCSGAVTCADDIYQTGEIILKCDADKDE